MEGEIFRHASREELAEDAQDITVGDPFSHPIDDEVVGDVVEEGLDVSIHDPPVPGSVGGEYCFNRLMSVAARAKAKQALREVWLEDGFKERMHDLLSHPVSDGGDAQRTQFAFAFGDIGSAEGGGVVAPFMFEVEHQGGEVVVQIGFKRADVHLIHPGSPAIAFDGLKGAAHASHVNSSGQGMDFTALVGQRTLLTERRCCEAAEAEPAGHSRLGRRLFRR